MLRGGLQGEFYGRFGGERLPHRPLLVEGGGAEPPAYRLDHFVDACAHDRRERRRCCTAQGVGRTEEHGGPLEVALVEGDTGELLEAVAEPRPAGEFRTEGDGLAQALAGLVEMAL